MFSRLKRNRGKVILKFLVIFAILFVLSKILPLRPLDIMTGWLVGLFLKSTSAEVQVKENVITYNNTEFVIVRECTGIESIIMLLAIVLADDKLKRKKQILIIGVPILYIWNIFRVAISILIGIEFGHFMLWMVSVLLIIGLVSYGYDDIVAQVRKKDSGKRRSDEHGIRDSRHKKRVSRRKDKNTQWRRTSSS